jgi:hypothetical protein
VREKRAVAGAFPGLRESLPLLFFGVAAVVTAITLQITHTSPIASRVPVWEFVLILGAVAILGGLLGSRVADDPEVQTLPTRSPPREVVEEEPDFATAPPTEANPPEWEEPWAEDPLRELSDIEIAILESRKGASGTLVRPESRPNPSGGSLGRTAD